MKRIRNWKPIIEMADIHFALKTLRTQKVEGYTGPFAIKCGNRFISPEDTKIDMHFKLEEIDGLWKILIPDNDEEQKNEKIRELMKASNCSGYNYNKIDNMTIDEIWKSVSDSLSRDKKYRLLLLYYNNKIYKD